MRTMKNKQGQTVRISSLHLLRVHYLNGQHIFCRLCDIGFNRSRAWKLARLLCTVIV